MVGFLERKKRIKKKENSRRDICHLNQAPTFASEITPLLAWLVTLPTPSRPSTPDSAPRVESHAGFPRPFHMSYPTIPPQIASSPSLSTDRVPLSSAIS